jgi:hypothetical protein
MQAPSVTPEIVEEVAEELRMNLITEVVPPDANLLDERKKILAAQFRTIDELKESPRKAYGKATWSQE